MFLFPANDSVLMSKLDESLKCCPLLNQTKEGLTFNESLKCCTLLSQTEEGFTISDVVYNPWFALLTLAFIYMPSLNVLATLYGPSKAGILGGVWGIVMTVVGTVLAAVVIDGDDDETLRLYAIGYFILFLGAAMVFLGGIMMFQSGLGFHFSLSSLSDLLLCSLLFPLLLPLSPLIFVCLKFISLLKPNNTLLKAQSTLGSRGESILEAAPQFALQCYIVLLSMSPTWSQWFSLVTSTLSLSPANIEYYVTACLEEKKRKKKSEEYEKPMETFGPISILKNIGVFLPISLFRIMAVSILCVFFRGGEKVFIVIIGNWIVLAFCLLITNCCYNLRGEKDMGRQFFECCIMSFLTMTNLGRGKTAALYRMVSTLFWIIAHTITLTVILAILNWNRPGIVIITCN